MHSSDELFPLYQPFKSLCMLSLRNVSHLWRLETGANHPSQTKEELSQVASSLHLFAWRLSAWEASFPLEEHYSQIVSATHSQSIRLHSQADPSTRSLHTCPQRGLSPLGILWNSIRTWKSSPAFLSSWGTNDLPPPWGLGRRWGFKSGVIFDATFDIIWSSSFRVISEHLLSLQPSGGRLLNARPRPLLIRAEGSEANYFSLKCCRTKTKLINGRNESQHFRSIIRSVYEDWNPCNSLHGQF